MLIKVTREQYEAAKAKVPEHDTRIREIRRGLSLYYIQQEVFSPDGRLVARHNENGQAWVDETLIS